MRKKLFLGLLALTGIAHATSFGIPEYTGYVTDNANLFNDHVEPHLVRQIESIEEKTTAEVAVLTVISTDGIPISQYATEVGHEWGVGKADVDNGIMIVIAVGDRQWFMASGYGVEGVLPDLRLKKIGERHFPDNFRNRNYFQGVSAVLTDIEGFLVQDESIVSKYNGGENEDLWKLILALHIFLTLLVLLAFSLRKKDKSKIFFRKPQAFFIIGGVLLLGLFLSAGLLYFYFFYFLACVGENGDVAGSGGWSSGGGWSGGGGGFGGFGGGGFGGGGAGGGW